MCNAFKKVSKSSSHSFIVTWVAQVIPLLLPKKQFLVLGSGLLTAC